MHTPTRPTRRVIFQVVTVLALLAAAVWLLAHTDYRIDIDVYRMGGRAWLDGTPLYADTTEFHTQAGIDLPFTYPPLAAVVFAPFAWLPLPAAGIAITVLTLALLVLSTKIVLTSLEVGAGAAQRWWLAAAISAPAAVLLEPLHANFDFGQINVVLMTLVLADCAQRRTRWPRGLLIGIAIAVKLTPAVFLLYFVLRRDLRAAAVALGSFLAATAVGFALAWRDSIQYWTSTIHDTGRIGTPTLNTNQNISAALARLGLGDDARFMVWALCCLLVLALTVWAGRRAVAAGQPLLTLICVALFGLAVSPVSWSHHWVWALPTLITTAVLARRWSSTALGVLTGVGLILMTSYPILLMPEHHEAQAAWWRQLVGTSYLWWALAVIATVGFVCGARLSRPQNPEAGTTTDSGSGAAALRPL
ncbi:DUF2029 domain-containing protein [Mycolicibacterium brumae]|uniref:DUF2029 domain-containing protein n=2 Tax=Mycolicibacterium brumae TaxID=85968 RepID=A0A2G5P6Z5_9MYCO|nr:glycosyltransferase 87 family protein [Mycolicibacterium brumae]PIB74122.1 DUF2029 domain-containing protein [Mycolicibacterium brumae]